jgi:hypothetical protein
MGSSEGAILKMKEKGQKWINKAKGGWSCKHEFWFLMDKQFWPGVSFGVSSITAPLRR